MYTPSGYLEPTTIGKADLFKYVEKLSVQTSSSSTLICFVITKIPCYFLCAITTEKMKNC